MTEQESPSNVLFVFTDQQRADSLDEYGGLRAQIPVLDGLAHDGIAFDRAYTPTAVCSPARASVVTGLEPHEHGFVSNPARGWGSRTDLSEEVTYPQLLRDTGYNVGLVGKWHLGEHPERFGFDAVHYAGWGQQLDHEEYLKYLDERDLPRFEENRIERVFGDHDAGVTLGGIDTRPPEASFTYFLAERTIEMLERYAEEAPETPFYISSNFFGPHLPYRIPEEYYDVYDPADVDLPESAVKETFRSKPVVQRVYSDYWGLDALSVRQWKELVAMYMGFVTFIDDQVGRILGALDDLGLRDDTAVFYSSDHGGFVTSHKLQDKGPAMYEDIYNIPLVARIPGVDTAGTDDVFVSLLDLAPTFLDLADVPIPEQFDGQSLLDLFAGEQWRDSITAEFHGHHFPYSQRMLRTDRYKLVLNPSERSELYDLETDPHELTNRIDDPEYAEVKTTLYEELKAELADENYFFPEL